MTQVFRVFIALIALAIPAAAAEVGDDGLHKQPWFADTFLEMADDLAEATAEGKDLLVLIEQNGCPYCREMHEVNFARPEIVDYLTAHFMVVQLDMFGAREVTDFDGEVLEEREMMMKWGANFTPTAIFFTQEGEAAPADFFEAEAFRMPGYFKPFHHLMSLKYVAEDGYVDTPFQRFLQAEAERMREEGEAVEIWE